MVEALQLDQVITLKVLAYTREKGELDQLDCLLYPPLLGSPYRLDRLH